MSTAADVASIRKTINIHPPTLPPAWRVHPRYRVGRGALWDMWHPHGGIALIVDPDGDERVYLRLAEMMSRDEAGV